MGVRAQENNVLVHSDILKMKIKVAFAGRVGAGQGVKDKSLPYSRILINTGGIMELENYSLKKKKENYSLIAITVIIHTRNINRGAKTDEGKA